MRVRGAFQGRKTGMNPAQFVESAVRSAEGDGIGKNRAIVHAIPFFVTLYWGVET
jgi:hypothetical protein